MHPSKVQAETGQTLRLRDGRTLGYAEYGQPGGRPLLYFHGHPGARLEARFLAEAAGQAGVRLIGVDRPGLGLSTYRPGRRLLDWPDDVAALADHLRLDRFAVVGFSGGGPYALACAHRLPERVTAAGVVAGVGRVALFLAFLSQWVPWLMLPLTSGFFKDEARAQQTLARFATRWAAPDQESLARPGIRELMARSLVEALRPGTRGAAYDGALLGRAWGFKPEAIRGPRLHWWHGEQDKEVPAGAARALAARLPGCQAAFFSGEGHISVIVNHAQAIVQALA